ncbi:MAG: HlyD family efflux transporter periplasmic adaptor subunit [Magnetococcales bacterium]|nr:HlyD family efflux transporter periplasmic adaptor subunit [Magnetococcales bacterium]
MAASDHRAMNTLETDNSFDDSFVLPGLRYDLQLFSGPTQWDGSPTWTLYDPVKHSYFRLGWLEHTILAFWCRGTSDSLLKAVFQEEGIYVTTQQVGTVLEFCSKNGLLNEAGFSSSQELALRVAPGKKNILKWLLHHYLYFRIPLFQPTQLLKKLTPIIILFQSHYFYVLLTIFGTLGLYLSSRNWDTFEVTIAHFYSTSGMLWFLAVILITKIIHELGHGVMAMRYGCRVPVMGVAFLVLWPVLYSDVSEAWKLQSKKARLAIGAAGVYAELMVAVFATFIWNFLPACAAQNGMVLVATVTWISTLAINLNPFLRFDGYYLLSDYLGIANLQSRSFALARWKLRELLFNFGLSPPEQLPKSLRRTLIGFAYATWIYRLILFVGIALLVYHLVFKLAGIVLLLAELGWFIAMPVSREFKQWWLLRDEIKMKSRIILLLVLMAFISLLVVPWQGSLTIPALWDSSSRHLIYSPMPAQVFEKLVVKGENVNIGHTLLKLKSPQLEQQIKQSKIRTELLKYQISKASNNYQTMGQINSLKDSLSLAMVEYNSLLERQRKLIITAPSSGKITEITNGLAKGQWVDATAPLLQLVNLEKNHIEAYVDEAQYGLLQKNSYGTFYANALSIKPIKVQLVKIDPAGITTINKPHFASQYGGEIVVQTDAKGRLLPQKALYKVILTPIKPSMTFSHTVVGKVRLEAQKRSLLQRAWLVAAKVLIRESGF